MRALTFTDQHRHALCVVTLGSLAGDSKPDALSARPTLGIALASDLQGSCSLGSLGGDGADLLDQARRIDVPPVGTRVVLGRTDLTTLAAAAWLELRVHGGEQPGRGRMHTLVASLQRRSDLCAMLRWSDHRDFTDQDAAWQRALLCDLAHDDRYPLRYRLDVIASHLRLGGFIGQRHATLDLRSRLDRLQAGARRTGQPTSRPRTSPSARKPEPTAAASPPVPPASERSTGSRVRIAPDELRARVTSDANLYAAWERVRDNARARGRFSNSLKRFEAELGAKLAEIATQLRQGTWEPSRLVHVPIAKSGANRDDVRHLHVPPVADRVVERAVSQVIGTLIDPHLSPWSFAFRPGRGVADAVRELAVRRDDGATHVARFDVADCFNSLDRDRLRAGLRRYLDDPWLLRLVDQLIDRNLTGLTREEHLVGIAQGAPLSPLLANILLEDLDTALFAAGYAPIRYADDIAVPATSAEDAHTAIAVAVDRATALDLTINPDKSEVVAFADVVEFLGERLGPDTPAAEDSATAPLPATRTLYLTGRCGHVQLRRGHIRALTRDGEELLSVPVRAVARLVVMGPTSISAGLRSYAFSNDLEVLFLSRNGSFLGRFDGGCEVEPQLRRRQYALLDDHPERVRIARSLAAGKLANQRALLLRYGRRTDGTSDCDATDMLAQQLRDLEGATSLAQIMGHEGAATKRYHRALANLLPPEAGFTRRTKRPPKDPANAALSFGYTLLTGEAHAAIAAAGVDPQVGLLHAPGRRPALAFDLVEEFRPLIVDSLVVAGFRRIRLTGDSFRSRADGAVLLNHSGRQALIDMYESRMLSRYRSALTQIRHTYRAGMHEQARHLADVIAGREPAYRPLMWR